MGYPLSMKKYLQHPVVRNALALYSVQFAEYVLPMITIPYLARILEPSGWGLVAYAQNFSAWMILVIEYGFGFSASRAIARQRDNPDGHADVVGGILGANFLLLMPALLIGLIARFTVPVFRDHAGYLWLSVAVAVVSGFRPFWYFQGIERMTYPAWLNVFGRLLYTIGIFVFVHSQHSAWIALALQAASGGLVTCLLAYSMYKRVSFQWPTFERSIAALRAGWAIFLSRSAVMLYTTANAFILGLFASTALVAYYVGAERVVLVILGLMTPFTQALYPRMTHLAANDQAKATNAIRLGLMIFGAVGLVACIALIVAAPLVIHLLLGKSYLPAVGVLRVASLAIPFVAMSNILGMQWMLPFGMDRAFNRISLGAGVLNLILGVFLAWRFGPLGSAWSVVASQGFVTTSMYILYLRASRTQFTQSTHS
jgi:PST family polysaccharide transporter